MNTELSIRLLEACDIQLIAAAFSAIGWDKPAAQYERYLSEQNEGRRTVLVANVGDEFAGYLTIRWQSDYLPFRQERIPEIVDLNVLPRFRRRGIGTALMDEAERRIAERSPVAGIGVGMDADYGPAQRMYVLRGYVPDGRGLTYRSRHLKYGDRVTVDEALALFFTKQLNGNSEKLRWRT